jgi:hypothetical protein
MAVGANHLALRDLIEDRLPRTVANATCDVELLVTEVIELEDKRILLAAVHTALLGEEFQEIFRALVHESLFAPRRLCHVAIAVREVVGSFVRGAALAAVGVEQFERLSVPGKLRDWLQLAATTAALASRDDWHERMFA